MKRDSSEDGATETGRHSVRRAATVALGILSVLGVAQVILDAEVRRGSRIKHVPKIGNVVEILADDVSSYEGEGVQTNPDFVLVGDSQQIYLAAAKNEFTEMRSGGDMIVDDFARQFEAQYPASQPRTFVRFALTALSLLEAVATVGLWLERVPAQPRVAAISVGLPVQSGPRHTGGLIRSEVADVMNRYLDSTHRLLETLARVEGGKAAADAITAALAREKPPPYSAEGIEAEIRRRLHDGEYFEGNQLEVRRWSLRYQKVEAPILQLLFGRVDQSLVRDEPNDPSSFSGFEFLPVLVRLLAFRGIHPVCYVQPYNPNSELPPKLAERYRERFEQLQRDARAAGCDFIDLSHAVSADPANWGWVGTGHDIDHLTPAGIHATAGALLTKGAQINAWSSLTRAKPAKASEGAE